MAQSFTDDSGNTYVIPDAYPSITVQQSASGLATSGILMLVGEADGGPDFTQELDLNANLYGPGQLGDVQAKYRSGQLVDAVRALATPANDPSIPGAPQGFVLVKTNAGGKATVLVPNSTGGNYPKALFDRNWGILGNTIYVTTSAAQQELVPTTGPFTYVPPVGTVNGTIRVNGAGAVSLALSANESPVAFVAAVGALSGIAASGGALRTVIPGVSGNLTVAASGNQVTITYTGTWTTTPTAGDTLQIPPGSAITGAGNANDGAYVVTGATNNSIVATKLSDAGKSGASAGTITAPVNVASTAVLATTDLSDYSPVTITLSGTPAAASNEGPVLDGVGKTLEVNGLTTGTDLLTRTAYVLGTVTPVTWISVTGTPALLVSAAEYEVQLNVNQQSSNTQETLDAGGAISLLIGYTGTSCAVTVTATTLTTTVVGGSGANLNIALKSYSTLADLAAFINAQPGYTCSVGSTAVGQQSPLALDEVTAAGAGTTFGNPTLRLKSDAVAFMLSANGSSLVQLGNPSAGTPFVPAPLGLPGVTPATLFLAGGARGGTSNATYEAAIDALKAVKGNFLVPLFSQDASANIPLGYTDSTSTYTVATIQAYAKTHVLAMSTPRRKRNRQAFLSNRGTFAAAQAAAQTLASARCSLTFQDVKVVGANGVVQFQPWMLAGLAAGMQAAGFYRAIFNKGINCSGVLQGAVTPPDYRDSDPDQPATALEAGLLVAEKSDGGGFDFVSDQTTYSKDNNFVYNSIQANYAADTIATTCAQRMKQSFVGQSVADVTAGLALASLESIMADFLRLKLIAVSDDAPKGFKDAVIRIAGPTMLVTVNVKLAGALYFISIPFTVSMVTQTASQ